MKYTTRNGKEINTEIEQTSEEQKKIERLDKLFVNMSLDEQYLIDKQARENAKKNKIYGKYANSLQAIRIERYKILEELLKNK